MTYRSKVDWWVALLLLWAPAVIIAVTWYGRGTPLNPELFFLLGVIVLIYGAAVLPMRYQLNADHLLVRSGLLRWRVPYQNITAVETGTVFWSGPALSLDRIKIYYSGGMWPFIVISPERRDEFLRELELRAPQTAARGRAGMF